jgi:hypothetical protein
MLNYSDIKHNKRELLALTGLTIKEFQMILPAFDAAYRRIYESELTHEGTPRKRKAGAGRSSSLDSSEQKLLFMLVYHKAYPIQAVQGALFSMSQTSASFWIHRLMPVLKDALTELGFMPEREGTRLAASEDAKDERPDYVIDGTERRRQRPKDAEKQVSHYSGKKKQHTDKNIVVSQTQTGRVAYLSPTRPGTVHDKKLADEEQITFPKESTVHKDTGFQGYEPDVKLTLQPKKSRKARS